MHTAPQGYLLIGEAAKRLNKSVDTLRRWETIGTLTPVRRDGSNVRLYAVEDIEALESAA